MGHSMADPIHGHYRTKEELEEQKRRDPIENLRRRLADDGLVDHEDYALLERRIHEEVADALTFAEESPDPDPGELYTDVYHE